MMRTLIGAGSALKAGFPRTTARNRRKVLRHFVSVVMMGGVFKGGWGLGNESSFFSLSEIVVATHAISSPRMVPVDDANLSDSMPMRWSMET